MKLFRMIAILIAVVILAYYLSRYLFKIIVYPTKYKEVVIEEAVSLGVDPYLVFAVIKRESRFNKKAVSSKGAKGLMQIMDSTASDVIRTNPNVLSNEDYDIFEPEINISVGVRYLKQLIDRYNGDVVIALCAYNAGLGNVDKWLKDESIFQDGKIIVENIPFNETKNYIDIVLKYYAGYKRSYDK